MKKLIMAAAAITAGLAIADSSVVSSDIVGYTNRDVGYTGGGQGTALVLNPFLDVQAGESRTLGDFKVNQTWDGDAWDCTGFLPGIDNIQILDANGHFIGQYTYYCADKIAEDLGLTADEGWYAMSDTELTTCMNNYALPYGSGVVLLAGDGNGVMPAVTLAGSVKKTATVVTLTPTTITGNVTPATIKLSKITTNQVWDGDAWDCFGFLPGIDTLQTMDAAGHFNGEYTYFCADKISEDLGLAAEAGWYAMSDTELTTPVGNLEFPAGQAFVFVVGDGNGVTPAITVPSAL